MNVKTVAPPQIKLAPEVELFSRKEAIGLLGGNFNPVHLGHLAAAQSVLETLQLERVDFLPSFLPPHVDHKETINPKERLAMLKLAIGDNPQFGIEPCEILRGGKSFTIETIKELQARYPEREYYFIIGGDMVEYLPKWKDIEELVQLVHFVGVNRPHYQRTSPYPIIYVDVPQLDISSSLIRQKIALGQSPRYLLPESVLHYIVEKGLYQDGKH
ncbi:nicotinate-nucleotide adenylyltransferase [Enterococcus nangangensis]|uniref:nicotinate-nucleotide adenylyltransferase n=1 Tax=Enterococcus nangangensis TaxID=2559926 RepID=UPI0010F72AE8